SPGRWGFWTWPVDRSSGRVIMRTRWPNIDFSCARGSSTMRRTFLTVWVCALPLLAAADEGFTPLFDGKSLTGWEPVGGKADNWTAQDGLLITKGSGGGWLSTSRTYSDFVLRLEYRTQEGGNSGVFIRAPHEGDPAYTGMEIQL